jgi:hypothetical protein
MIAAEAKKASDAMVTNSRNAANKIVKDYEKITKAAIASTIERIRLEQHVNETRLHLTETAQNAVKSMVEQGVLTERMAATEKVKIYRQLAREFIKTEQEKTSALDRESHRRDVIMPRTRPGRAGASDGGGGGGGGGASAGRGGWRERAGRAAAFVGSQLASAADRTMSAQEQYAAFERSTSETFYQTTSDRREIAHRRGQLMAYAQAHNIEFGEVAQAAAEAQGEFGALGSRSDTVAQREEKMGAFLRNVGVSRAMGQDVVQSSRFAGALAASGMSGQAQESAMRQATGMAMRGSVELGDMSRQGLRSMMTSLGTTMSRVGPNASQAQIDAALNETLQQQFAAQQILAPRGINVTASGNALTSVATKLGSERTQTALLDHLRNTYGQNSQAEQRLFQKRRDGTSALRSEYRDVYRFGEALSDITGGDPDALRNLLATQTDRSSGHVLREVLLKNERNTFAGLTQLGAGGKSGFQAMRELKEGASLTQEDVTKGRDIFEHDTQANLTHLKQQAMLNLLGGNEDRAASLQREREAEHGGFYGLINSLPGGQFIAQTVFRAQAGVEGAVGSRGTTTGELPGIGANGLPVAFSGSSVNELAKAIGDQIRQNPPVINIDPHTLAHAQTSAATGANAPSPEQRAANR